MPDQTGLFWHNGSGLEYEDGGAFSDGWFRKAKISITSPSDEVISYAGVRNQFFATVIQSKSPEITSVWAKSTKEKRPNENDAVTSVNGGLRFPTETLEPDAVKSC